MTLEEKLGQMSQHSVGGPISGESQRGNPKGAVGIVPQRGQRRLTAPRRSDIAVKESRLGIPLIFGRDVIHGYRTIFPIPLGQSASWDPESDRAGGAGGGARGVGKRASTGRSRRCSTSRATRAGAASRRRLGEDPYLASALGGGDGARFPGRLARMRRGRSRRAPSTTSATARPRAAGTTTPRGFPESLLRDVYLRPFHAAVEAGVATVMSAFNDLNGVPTSGNAFTLREVLRDEWKFDGFVVSDYESVTEMIPHGYAADPREAALEGGARAAWIWRWSAPATDSNLKPLVEAGVVDRRLIDDAVRNILRVKFRLGLFDRADAARRRDGGCRRRGARGTPRHWRARASVLLKNENGVLPLPKSASASIAVIGPLADAPYDQMGSWVMDGRPETLRTPLAACARRWARTRIAYCAGAAEQPRPRAATAFAAARRGRRGAPTPCCCSSAKSRSSRARRTRRAFLNLPGAQEALVEEVAKTGKPIVARHPGRPSAHVRRA